MKFEDDAPLAKRFVAEIPELTCLYQHEQNVGGVFDTLFFGNALAKTVRLIYRRSLEKKSFAKASALLKRISDFLETLAVSNDDYALNVLGTGFLESLYLLGEDYEAIRNMFGPKTIEMLELVEAEVDMHSDLGIGTHRRIMRDIHQCIDQIFEPTKR